MSSVVAMSAMTLPNNNNNTSNHKNNNSSNDLNECSNQNQELLNNLKLIKNKVNGHKGHEEYVSCDEVINKCNNGFNESQININEEQDVIDSENIRKSLKIPLKNSDSFDETYSEASTLSSSPVTSPLDETIGRIDEALLEQKFSKLALNELRRSDSPQIQINGNDSFDDDEEECDDDMISRIPLLRSTSLKTGKTPPSTPCRKKFVRFADALGLDLESVRHIISDDLPTVPQSAFGPLKNYDRKETITSNNNGIPWFLQKQNTHSNHNKPILQMEFIQPSSLLNFIDRIRNNKICLENCMVSNGAGNLSITCIIRVLNISFEKIVTLRYTTNGWFTCNEALASYIPNSCDGFSDKFTVTFSVSSGGYYLSPGQRLLFAIRYKTSTEEYWDNNMGLNYSLIYRV